MKTKSRFYHNKDELFAFLLFVLCLVASFFNGNVHDQALSLLN
jgi:hypothetical protein